VLLVVSLAKVVGAAGISGPYLALYFLFISTAIPLKSVMEGKIIMIT